MIIKLAENKTALGRMAGEHAAGSIRRAIAARGRARVLACSGASQFEFLETLVAVSDVEWPKVELFHLDEYVGLPITHPGSFRKYLQERLIGRTGISLYYFLDGEQDPAEVCRSVGKQISEAPIDVAFVGIGENSHLAFNDPPADFEIEEPYIIVHLDEACRRQQVGEGWFGSLSEVPERAISISIRQLLKASEILCSVPDARKARAVKACLEGPISPLAPASILQTHPNTTIFLDPDSASLLSPEFLRKSK